MNYLRHNPKIEMLADKVLISYPERRRPFNKSQVIEVLSAIIGIEITERALKVDPCFKGNLTTTVDELSREVLLKFGNLEP